MISKHPPAPLTGQERASLTGRPPPPLRACGPCRPRFGAFDRRGGGEPSLRNSPSLPRSVWIVSAPGRLRTCSARARPLPPYGGGGRKGLRPEVDFEERSPFRLPEARARAARQARSGPCRPSVVARSRPETRDPSRSDPQPGTMLPVPRCAVRLRYLRLRRTSPLPSQQNISTGAVLPLARICPEPCGLTATASLTIGEKGGLPRPGTGPTVPKTQVRHSLCPFE